MLMFPAIQILLNFFNYGYTKKIISFLFLNFAMLISSVASLEITTLLYYTNVSADSETLAVGSASVQICIAFVGIMTLISAIFKFIDKKSKN